MQLKAEKIETAGDITYYECEGYRYKRILGGIGWPGDKPGFIVILGDTEKVNPPFEYRVIKEQQVRDLSRLFEFCIRFKQIYLVEAYYARETEDILNYLAHFNIEMQNFGKPSFYFYEPFPTDGTLKPLLHLIRESLQPARRTLHIPINSKLMQCIAEVPEFPDELKDKDYPAAAALGYVLEAMKTYSPLSVNTKPYQAETTDVMARLRGKK
jgi:hypothetical protein